MKTEISPGVITMRMTADEAQEIAEALHGHKSQSTLITEVCYQLAMCITDVRYAGRLRQIVKGDLISANPASARPWASLVLTSTSNAGGYP
jgi:hypothetical protein